MKTTERYVVPDHSGTIPRNRSIILAYLIWTAFPMSSNGDLAVGVLHGDVFMSWTINNTNISSTRRVRNPKNDTVIRFAANSYIGNLSSSFTDRVRNIGNVSHGIVSFYLLNLTAEDAGNYCYSIDNRGDVGGQILIIAGFPSKVSINETSDPFEHEKYTMRCNAKTTSIPPGMGLNMHYLWKWVNGQTITVSDRYSFSTDHSDFIINPLVIQDAGSIVCEAWEHVEAVSSSNRFSLKVFYGPDPDSIHLSPNETLHELTESSLLSVNCYADCSPDCEYRWTGPDGSSNSDTGLLYITSIGRNQTGYYTCTSSNSRNTNKTATTTIRVAVFYGPDERNVSLSPNNTSYNLKELSPLAVHCIATCVPHCGYQWLGPLVNQIDNIGILNISQISRNHNGTFACAVTNPRIPGRTATANFTAVVYYGPDIPHLSPNTMVYTKLEGESVPDINCSADCFPGCTQVWMKGVTAVQGSNLGTLALRQVYRDNSGEYTCWCNNTESKVTGYISIKLIVQYPPVLRMEATNTSKGGIVVINCMASGVPNNYTFYKWTQMAPDESRTIVRELEVTRVSGSEVSLTIQRANYQDSGFYSCKANNGITHYITGQLIAEEMVFVWITDEPIITSSAREFYAEKGKAGNMHIEFYSGLFQPMVTWYRVNNGLIEPLQNSSDFRISLSAVTVKLQYYQKTVRLPGYNACMEVFDVRDEQFASYMVEINNSFGEPVFGKIQFKPRVMDLKGELENANGSPVIIGAATGSALILVIAVVIVGLFFYKRRQSVKSPGENQDDLQDETRSSDRRQNGLVDNPVYDSSVSLPNPSTSGDATGVEYATVVKPKKKGGRMEASANLFAQVDKTHMGKQKGQVKTKIGKAPRGEIYINATLAGRDNLKGDMHSGDLKAEEHVNACEEASKGSLSTKDGLTYAELMLDITTTKNGQYVIRGLENRTEYAQIAYGKRGQPIHDNKEEK